MACNAKEFFEIEIKESRPYRSGEKVAGALRKVVSLAAVLEPVLAGLYEKGEWKREEWIDCQLPGVELRGVIDIRGSDVICDIKTSKDFKWLKVEQLEFYAFILKQNGIEVGQGCFITPAMGQKLHHHKLYPWRLERIGMLVGEVVRDMRAEKYEPTPGVACHNCFYDRWCEHRRAS